MTLRNLCGACVVLSSLVVTGLCRADDTPFSGLTFPVFDEDLIAWKTIEPIKEANVSKSPSLNDIESHMKNGHSFSDHDQVTWGHETTHGLNSKLRMRHGGSGRVNAFYCLDNRYVVFQEPNLTINQVAQNVPDYLRGTSFNLYMRQGPWNRQPLYIVDEWVSYTNGSQIRYELGVTSRGASVKQMMDFAVYAATLCSMLPDDYEQKDELSNFIRWQFARSMKVLEQNETVGGVAQASNYLLLAQDDLSEMLMPDMPEYAGPWQAIVCQGGDNAWIFANWKIGRGLDGRLLDVIPHTEIKTFARSILAFAFGKSPAKLRKQDQRPVGECQ